MNNYFQQKKRTASLQHNTTVKKPKVILNNSFNERRTQFIQSLNPNFANCLLNGLYPTPKQPKELAKPITLSKFLNASDRIQHIIEDFSSSHLPRELYSEGPKLKLRERVISLEGPQWAYDIRPRLRKDEAEQRNQQNKSMIDAAPKDMTMVYFPKWKSDTKEHWKHEHGFITTVYPQSSELQYVSDVYIDGFEVLGDIGRKIDKDELNGRDFQCTIKSSNEPMPSISLRKAKQDEAYMKLYSLSQQPSEQSTNATRYPKIYSKSVRKEILAMANKRKTVA